MACENSVKQMAQPRSFNSAVGVIADKIETWLKIHKRRSPAPTGSLSAIAAANGTNPIEKDSLAPTGVAA
jgi:hypothetical protein